MNVVNDIAHKDKNLNLPLPWLRAFKMPSASHQNY